MRILSIMPINNKSLLINRNSQVNQNNKNYDSKIFYSSKINFGSFVKGDDLPKNFTEVIPGTLFVGGLPFAEHLKKFKKEGFTFVMDLSGKMGQQEAKIAGELDIKYIPIDGRNLYDDYKEGNLVFEAVQTIKKELTTPGSKGYVHCEHGEGRSRYIIRKYLSEVEGMDPSDAFEKLPPILT